MDRAPLFVLLALAALACPPSTDAPVRLEAPPPEDTVARPGFRASWTVDLVNDTQSTYAVTALSVQGDEGRFAVELDDPDAGFPVTLGPDGRVPVRVFFAPNTLGERTATLEVVAFLDDIQLGGGGCSSGAGREAPSSALLRLRSELRATATADAPFEDCRDGVDNDGDGAIDCEDRDCGGSASCLDTQGCEPTAEARCGARIEADTTARVNTFEQYCGIADDAFTAPEEIWSFTPEGPGPVTVSAEGDGWDLDLMLLRGSFNEDGVLQCDAGSCVARGTSDEPRESITFNAEAGGVYFFVLDGAEGEAGDYSLDVACGPLSETDCGDGIDDDGDGAIDCDDPDCEGEVECLPTGTCEPVRVLGCGDVVTGANAGADATDDVTSWCDDPEGRHTGNEVAWDFVVDSTADVTVTLTDLVSDLDVSALLLNPGGGGTCDPDLCVFDEAWARGPGDESVTFQAFAGTPYVIAVDGWDGATSPFTLEIACR